MVTSITEGIKVSVTPSYLPLHSSPKHAQYFFSYRIKIENFSEHTIQLLRRHWFVADSLLFKYEVEGDGVIGEQPILKPKESHGYDSACNIRSEAGKMYGYYTFVNVDTGKLFEVEIPEFSLFIPHLLN